jgi:septum formation protein
MGKPKSIIEAKEHLLSFSGRTHQVITALALYNGNTGRFIQKTSRTEVNFAKLSSEEIDWYLGTLEWQDVAGSYRIQEKGSLLINSISGSWYNVIGLPIRLFYGMVASQGLSFFRP